MSRNTLFDVSTYDPKIDRLILKWANNVNGKWSDIIRDLVAYTKEIREEEREKYSNFTIDK